MAETDFGSLSAIQKKIYSTKVRMVGRDNNFWKTNGFVGGETSIIERITELTQTERGDKCVMQLVPDLVQDGTVGDNELTGNEEAMIADAQEIQIDMLRHGVKNKGQMSEQKTVIRFRSTAQERLGFWIGDKQDEMTFLVASGVSLAFKTDGSTRSGSQLANLAFNAQISAPTSGRKIFAAGTSTASLTTSDKLSWSLVVSARTFAKRRKIKPLRSGGREYYCLVVSPEQERDLKLDATYLAVLQNAEVRGPDNPLFRGAIAVVDSTIIYSHNKIYNTGGLAASSKWGGSGTVDGAQALFMGAQCLGLAEIGDVKVTEADVNDYGNKPGIGLGFMIGMLKPVFVAPYEGTKQDFGVVSLYTAAALT